MRKRKRGTRFKFGLPSRLGYMAATFLLLSVLFFIVRNVDPLVLRDVGLPGMYIPFLMLVGMIIFFGLLSFSIVWWRSLWWSMVILIFLLLRIFGLGNILNAFLLMLLSGVMEYYVRISANQDELE